jgi:rubrerythrin
METAATLKSGTTLENLQAAFNGESNARAKYLAYAAKADEDGYGPVASLFRAAAHAEAIHAANHAEVIRKLGGTPEAVIATPPAKTTAENLKDAIAGETYERDVMYPAFLAQARAEKSVAVKTFHYALKAEAEHARLYAEALADLENRRGAGITYYVCPICGYTSATPEGDHCPICATPNEKFETVN